MKIKKIHLLAGLLAFLPYACSEREPKAYDGISGIYFNNRANISSSSALLDTVNLTFVYESSDEMDVPVKIQLLGATSSQARPIQVQVTSEDAQEGTDYVLPENPAMPADAASMDYVVTLKRTDALKQQAKTIELELLPNEYFSLPFTEEEQTNGQMVSYLHYRITFSDIFTSAPATWEEDIIGEFSQQKFELICKVLDIEPSDFNDSEQITLSKLMFIYSEMTQYVEEETAKRNNGEDFDEDIIDAQTGEPISFRPTVIN